MPTGRQRYIKQPQQVLGTLSITEVGGLAGWKEGTLERGGGSWLPFGSSGGAGDVRVLMICKAVIQHGGLQLRQAVVEAIVVQKDTRLYC